MTTMFTVSYSRSRNSGITNTLDSSALLSVHSVGTTHCTYSHQTLFLLRLNGVASENINIHVHGFLSRKRKASETSVASKRSKLHHSSNTAKKENSEQLYLVSIYYAVVV